ncbi:hypothetical protein FPV67DRAFT_1435052 [Lyophyllum atratum]|nr:hypothetical protein FPV67DRAFT_1435052 [Lyophyllum atratum]
MRTTNWVSPSVILRVNISLTTSETLARLSKDWTRPIYAFFKPVPDIRYVDGKRCHEFECGAKYCKGKSRLVRRFLHTSDKNSTGNLRRHAKKCWGQDVIEAADDAANADEARETIAANPKLRSGDITEAFARKGKGKVTYSYRQHTKAEARAEYVRWISESLRPIDIVKDRGFINLMKTGRPETYIPSPSTISCDIKLVFAKTKERVGKLLQEHDSALNFMTDAWTSPNHRSFVAFSTAFETNGVPVVLLLDFVEVAKSHTGVNLAEAFATMLKDFGIEDKVSIFD